MPEELTLIVYCAIAVYSITEFENTIKGVLLDMIMLIINMGIMQTVAMLMLMLIANIVVVDAGVTLACNIIVLFMILMFDRIVGYARVKTYLLEKQWLTKAIVSLSIISMTFGLVSIKRLKSMSDWFFVWVLFFCTLMFGTWYRWIKQKELIREQRADLQVQKLYYSSYEMLLKELRERQHEYKNHIQALQNEKYINTNELVSQQMRQQYYDELRYDDRFSGLLKCKNSIIVGFLFGKIKEAEQKQIYIKYTVEMYSEQYRIPTYIIIEMLGILLDNAIEAVKDNNEQKTISLEIIEEVDEIHIGVKNEIINMTAADFMKLFERNNSTKGSGRGLGLYKIQQYTKKYGWEIIVDFEEQQSKKYIVISLKGKK